MRLEAARGRLPALVGFYDEELGLDLAERGQDGLTLTVGETALELVAAPGEPFYHFALLVPGNRFREALEWARERTELLPDPDSGAVVFDFDNWHACACYFHDPAGNIVELIAHRGVEESRAEDAFRPSELVGLSELGLVGDAAGMARALAGLGLELWDGTVDEPGRLAFVGERARTLILAPRARGWLPTGRAAEPHAVELLVAAAAPAEAELEGGRYRIRTVGAD